jgi:hypothetical protein
MSLRPKFVFRVLFFAIVFVPSLFVPTIEAFQHNHSLGHIPVWCSYVGLVLPEYWAVAIPIVFAHIIGSLVLSFWICKLYCKAVSP